MTRSLVIGGTGIVGGYIVDQLVRNGERPYALSRSPKPPSASVEWLRGDLTSTVDWPNDIGVVYCTVNIAQLAAALPVIATPSLKRVVAFTSTSITTKIDTGTEAERALLRQLADGETALIAACEQRGIGWTILRPTLIYAEGRDENISRLARLIARFGFLPLAGAGRGLRQPVHAEDLAIGAIAAGRSDAAVNRIYALPGLDTMTYREMAGRIFDALGRRRRLIALPWWMWRLAFALLKAFFPKANAAMGARMEENFNFDASDAVRDFGWAPRPFRPRFPNAD